MTQPLALIDFTDGYMNNRGKADITALAIEAGFEPTIFDLRQKGEIPNIADFDVFISTGGPGDPADTGNWGDIYARFANNLLEHNKNNPTKPKTWFAICHSFQVLCEHVLKIGKTSRRPQILTGIHPQKTVQKSELPPFLQDLPESFLTLENRFYQVTQTAEHPDFVPFAMADFYLTGIVSRDGHIMGTQFHPEAREQSVTALLENPEQVKLIAELYGPNALKQMQSDIPNLATSHYLFLDFLKRAIKA